MQINFYADFSTFLCNHFWLIRSVNLIMSLRRSQSVPHLWREKLEKTITSQRSSWYDAFLRKKKMTTITGGKLMRWDASLSFLPAKQTQNAYSDRYNGDRSSSWQQIPEFRQTSSVYRLHDAVVSQDDNEEEEGNVGMKRRRVSVT